MKTPGYIDREAFEREVKKAAKQLRSEEKKRPKVVEQLTNRRESKRLRREFKEFAEREAQAEQRVREAQSQAEAMSRVAQAAIDQAFEKAQSRLREESERLRRVAADEVRAAIEQQDDRIRHEIAQLREAVDQLAKRDRTSREESEQARLAQEHRLRTLQERLVGQERRMAGNFEALERRLKEAQRQRVAPAESQAAGDTEREGLPQVPQQSPRFEPSRTRSLPPY